MTWDDLAAFIATLPADARRGRVAVWPDPVRSAGQGLPPVLMVSAAMPPTKHMGGPALMAYQPGA
jgi:hypothetical protein